MRPIGIDLFSGAGGLSLGFEQAGIDSVVAIDIDPIHCATYRFNFPNSKIICEDVSKLTGESIRAFADLPSIEIDVVFGGAPCQGFSMIGKRALDDPRNRLVKEFARLVIELNPKYFVFENVQGLTFKKQQKFLQELIDEFENNSYIVKKPYQVLNAAHFRVPQDRKRLFLLGARQDQKLPSYPEPRTSHPNGKQIEGSVFLPRGPTVWEAIGDLPEVEEYSELYDRDWVEADYGIPSSFAEYMRGLKRYPSDYSYPRKWDPNRLTSSLRAEHTTKSKSRFKKTKFGKTEPVSRFHKLDPDGISNTLRAGTGSDKGAFTSPRPIHPYTPRCITVREAARLHSFPDWFRFHVTKWHGFRQIGNSVPPWLGKAIGEKIVEALGVKPEKLRKKLQLGDSELLMVNMSQAAEFYNVSPDVTGKRIRVA